MRDRDPLGLNHCRRCSQADFLDRRQYEKDSEWASSGVQIALAMNHNALDKVYQGYIVHLVNHRYRANYEETWSRIEIFSAAPLALTKILQTYRSLQSCSLLNL